MIGNVVGDVVTVLSVNDKAFKGPMANATRSLKHLALAAVGFGAISVKAFATFEDAIIRSAAVTTGAVGEMREEMAKTALEMSKNAILSARELAEGYFALGQAGFNVAQSMKALPVVTDFAIASQVQLDTSVRYLVRTLEGLGMASDNAVQNMLQMERVSNVFTYAAIKTTAEIRDFAVAMTHAAAPALRLVNKSMEEGTSVLMAFAKAGIIGEEAGTLLWTTVRDLQRASIKARGEWVQLGLEIYDSQGKMRNLADIFTDLEEKFSGMSDEMKKVSLMLLGFQDRSLRGIQALMGFSPEMKKAQEEMKFIGRLTRDLSEKYMASFLSQMKMLWNHIKDVSIAVGRELAPAIQEIGDTFKRNQETIKGWAVAVAGYVSAVMDEFNRLLNFFITDWKKGLELVGMITAAVAEAIARILYYTIAEVFVGIAKDMGTWIQRGFFRRQELKRLASQYMQEAHSLSRQRKLADEYPDVFRQEMKKFEQAAEEYTNSAEFQKILDKKYPLEPFEFDPNRYVEIVEVMGKRINKVIEDTGYTAYRAGEKQKEPWIRLGKSLENIIVRPVRIVGKNLAIEAKRIWEGWWKPAEDRAAKVAAGMAILKNSLRGMIVDLHAQREAIGMTNEQLAEYNLQLNLVRKMEEEFGPQEFWLPEVLEKYNEELAKQKGILEVILEKQRGVEAFWTSMRLWIADAAYVWDEFGENLTHTLDSFSDELARVMTTGVDNWKSFTLALLQQWVSTLIKMQMANLAIGLGFDLTVPTRQVGPQPSGWPTTTYKGKIGLAEGGIATRPIEAVVGEAGPEAIIPLKQMDNMGNTTYNFHYEGMPLKLTRENEYMSSDGRIVDVFLKAVDNDPRVRRGVKGASR